MDENIFGLQATEVGIQLAPHDPKNFDKSHPNGPRFSEIQKWLESQTEKSGFFLKWSDTEHKLIVPIEEFNGQIEFILRWVDKLFYYEICINRKKKTRFEPLINLPEEKGTFISKTCTFKFIPQNEPYRSKDSLERLKKQVDGLILSSQVNISQQVELWEKFIEAQKLIIENLKKPIPIQKIGEPEVFEGGKGYNLPIHLKSERKPEYRAIEKELQSLDIFETFDDEGNIFLTFDGIERLKVILDRKFQEVVEVDSILAILRIQPFATHKFIIEELKKIEPSIRVYSDFEKGYLKFFPNVRGTPVHLPREMIRKFQLRRIGIISRFSFQKKSGETEYKEYDLLPKNCNDNVFFEKLKERVYQDSVNRKYRFLKLDIYNDASFELGDIYKTKLELQSNFTEKYWKDLKLEIYKSALDQVKINPTNERIYFQFKDRRDFEEIFNSLEKLKKFKINYSPEGYKFKVHIAIIARKTQEDIFNERLSHLSGVEMGIWEDRKFQSLGSLRSKQSSIHKLILGRYVFNKKGKEEIKVSLNYLDEFSQNLTQIEPNLRGDEAKIEWLGRAMKKITSPGAQARERPASEYLGKYIFDASQARPTFKDLSPESDIWKDVSKHKILALNPSQQAAVLRAVYAEDLCLLQGPPGTGKTTVIAEMIWQMIRLNPEQKILLTSETNLAVDNALERLMKSGRTLVKPIRFGRTEKIEEEGKVFSWDRIQKWLDKDYQIDDYENSIEEITEEEEMNDIQIDDPSNNAVQAWIRKIADRAYSYERDKRFDDVLENWSRNLAQPEREIKDLFCTNYREHANVIGSTCTSTGSQGFTRQYQEVFNNKEEYLESPSYKWNWLPVQFDVVIMDEASKATPPEMIMPLCLGKKSIIIGDHRQLPPMLHEKALREALEEYGGERGKVLAEEIDKEFVETSQFERLIMNPVIHESVKATFNVQYRMHPHINDVIRQFYLDEGGLEPGLEPDKVDLPDLSEPQSRYHGFYLDGFISPDIHTIWIDVKEPETQDGTSRHNLAEVDAIRCVLKCLHKSKGFQAYQNYWNKSFKDPVQRRQEQEIGLISFYGSQVKQIKENVKLYAERELDIPIRLNSVDKFQGMERNIIIVSTVRSDRKNISKSKVEPNGDIGFARSPKRLNVALSRARRLLIVVGNKDFFSQFRIHGQPIYKNVIEQIAQKGKIISYSELKELSL